VRRTGATAPPPPPWPPRSLAPPHSRSHLHGVGCPASPAGLPQRRVIPQGPQAPSRPRHGRSGRMLPSRACSHRAPRSGPLQWPSCGRCGRGQARRCPCATTSKPRRHRSIPRLHWPDPHRHNFLHWPDPHRHSLLRCCRQPSWRRRRHRKDPLRVRPKRRMRPRCHRAPSVPRS
jgi:hypothetical protein